MKNLCETCGRPEYVWNNGVRTQYLIVVRRDQPGKAVNAFICSRCLQKQLGKENNGTPN